MPLVAFTNVKKEYTGLARLAFPFEPPPCTCTRLKVGSIVTESMATPFVSWRVELPETSIPGFWPATRFNFTKLDESEARICP